MATKKVSAKKTTTITAEEKNFSLLAHLLGFAGYIVPFANIVGPLVVWLVKKDQSAFIEYHAKESLNFQISITIYILVASILTIVLIGFPILIGLIIFAIVVIIKAAIAANKAERYTYPFTLRLVS